MESKHPNGQWHQYPGIRFKLALGVGLFLLVWVPACAEWVSRWDRVADLYATQAPPAGVEIADSYLTARFETAFLKRSLGRGSWRVRIWASEQGLYVRRPFGFWFSRSIFVPWGKLARLPSPAHMVLGSSVTLRLQDVEVGWLQMPKKLFAQLEDKAPGKLPVREAPEAK